MQVSGDFLVPVDWSWLAVVGALVGDWLASDDAAWLAIVNRAASAADERAGVFHRQHQVQRIGRRGLELEVGIERVGLIVGGVH